jgi:putative ABC transport system permease protein
MAYPAYLSAGLRNRAGRNLAAVVCFALIAANIFSGQYLVAGEVESVGQGVGRMGADLLVVPQEYARAGQGAETEGSMALVAVAPSDHRFDGGVLGEIAGVAGVSGVSPQLYAGAVSVPELSAAPVHVYGVDPATDFTILPWLAAPLGAPLAPGEVILGHGLGRAVGDTVPIGGRTFTVAGVLDPTQSGIDGSVFVPLDDARGLAPGGVPADAVSAGLVRVAPGEDPEQVAFNITRPGSAATLTVVERHFALDPVSRSLQGLPGFLNTVSAVVVIAAFPLIALIAAMVAHERRREIGLLRAMGAGRRVVVVLVTAESLLLAAIGATAGVGASLGILLAMEANGVLASALQVSFRTPAATEVVVYAGITFLVVIAMAGLSSVYPAYRTGRMNPFDAIRVEGG